MPIGFFSFGGIAPVCCTGPWSILGLEVDSMGSVESIELSLLANSAVSSLKNKVTVPRDSGHVLYLNEPGLVVHKSGDTLLVKQDGNTLRQIPIKLIDQVVSISAVQWSGSAMAAMLSRGIPIHFLTVRGPFLGEL
jgi:hypothetical protein